MLHWLYFGITFSLLAWTSYKRIYLKERLYKSRYKALFYACLGSIILLMICYNIPTAWLKLSSADKCQAGVLSGFLLFMTVSAWQDVIFYRQQKQSVFDNPDHQLP
jgi:hypothetical protein